MCVNHSMEIKMHMQMATSYAAPTTQKSSVHFLSMQNCLHLKHDYSNLVIIYLQACGGRDLNCLHGN